MTYPLSRHLPIAAILVALSFPALSEDGPYDKAIKARQSMYQLYSFSIGILSGMAKGDIEYDADIAREAAENLSAAVSLGQSQFWPQGSDNQTEGNARTRALPEIWTTYPAIQEKAEDLNAAVAVLTPVAGNGLDALKGALGDVGAACKGCHDDYRAERR